MSIFGDFLVRIFPYSDQIRTRKAPNKDTFHRVCFITDCFIKPFKLIIKQFFFNRSFCSQDLLFRKLVRIVIFTFWHQDHARNIKGGNWERQIPKNGKLESLFKNNFGRLVINVTQINFLYWRNVYTWRLIKVHH